MKSKPTILRLFAIGLVGFFVSPLVTFASVEITEIMYDLEGGDADREWIEVTNTGSSAVDLSSYTFFEGDTNHTLSTDGNPMLSAGASAVIADDPSGFTSDFASYTGPLFDSSFSLNNTGEKLEIHNSGGGVDDSVTYSSDWGASGNGNSLQKDGSGWKEGTPTPGESMSSFSTNNTSEDDTDDEEEDESSDDETTSHSNNDSSSGNSVYVRDKPDNALYVDLSTPPTVVAGETVTFEVEATDESERVQDDAVVRWNFGDGLVDVGKTVEHIYSTPGTYTVVVQVKDEDLEVVKDVMVEVIPVQIEISEVKGNTVTIENKTNVTVDLSGWSIRANGGVFVFPHLSFLQKKSQVTITTHLGYIKRASLHFPSGSMASSYPRAENTHRSVQTNTSKPAVVSESEPQEEVENKVLQNSVSQETLALSAVPSEIPKKEQSYTWIMALFGVIVLGVVGSYGVRRGRGKELEDDIYIE